MCNFSYYDEYNGRKLLFCSITKNICAYSRWCGNQQKAIDNGSERCKMSKYTDIPKGSNRVIFKRNINNKEYLYIELGDTTIKIINTLKDVKDYVYIKKDELNGSYKISLKPFKKQKKEKEK